MFENETMVCDSCTFEVFGNKKELTDTKCPTCEKGTLRIAADYRHVYLYAKGHYDPDSGASLRGDKDNVLEELKLILSRRCGIAPEDYAVGDVIGCLTTVVYKHLDKEYRFFDLIMKSFKGGTLNTLFISETSCATVPRMLNAMMSLLAFVKTSEIEGCLGHKSEAIQSDLDKLRAKRANVSTESQLVVDGPIAEVEDGV